MKFGELVLQGLLRQRRGREQAPGEREAAAAPGTAAVPTRAAFAAMARRHEADLIRMGLRLCDGDAERAQDLVQDALVRAYEAYLAGKYREELRERAWLMRILTNVFLNDYRRTRRQETPADVAALEEARPVWDAFGPAGAPGANVPGHRLLAATLDEPLERALNTLTEPFRLCVLLVDVEGWTYAEAAAALGVPLGTVRSRLARARLLLHEALYEYARERRMI